jgi:hypothetical protein
LSPSSTLEGEGDLRFEYARAEDSSRMIPMQELIEEKILDLL